MLNGAIIELAIGLSLIFFVFSIVVSGLYEGLAKVLAWRAKSLWAAIHLMVTGPNPPERPNAGQRLVNAAPVGDVRPNVGVSDGSSIAVRLYAHPLVGGLEQRAKNAKTRIDQIEPSNFARALIDALVPDREDKTSVDTWMTAIHTNPDVPAALKQQLEALVREADNDFTTLRTKVETWFDAQMSTLSRRYRKRARLFTLAFGLAVAIGFNVDALHATDRLYHDDIARSALVSQADSVVAGCAGRTGDDLATCLDDAGSAASRTVPLPVGWRDADIGALSPLGWMIGGLAIAQGAPFWFAILKRAINYRRSRAEPAPG